MEQYIKQDICIGENISKARIALKLSQEQLAAKLQTDYCDITRGTIAKIEVGLRHIKVSELRAISKTLNISYDLLIDGFDITRN